MPSKGDSGEFAHSEARDLGADVTSHMSKDDLAAAIAKANRREDRKRRGGR